MAAWRWIGQAEAGLTANCTRQARRRVEGVHEERAKSGAVAGEVRPRGARKRTPPRTRAPLERREVELVRDLVEVVGIEEEVDVHVVVEVKVGVHVRVVQQQRALHADRSTNVSAVQPLKAS